MNIERLFGVLVLGGAALTAPGCNDEEDPREGAGPLNEGAGSSGSGSSGSGAGNATGGDDGGGATNAGGQSAGGTSAGGEGSGGEPQLECSDPADPGDACGCPCCWVTMCDNTDEDCCGGFCHIGNNGAGCCGL